MKKILVCLSALLFILSSCHHTQANKNTEKTNTADSVSAKVDSVMIIEEKTPSAEDLETYFSKQKTGSGVFIQPNNIASNGDGVYCYFRLKNDKATALRLHIQYWNYTEADQYVFNADGKSFTYIANKNQSGSANQQIVQSSVFYWFDNEMKKNDLEFVEALADAQKAQISLVDRGTGETLATIVLSESVKQTLRRTIDYYNALDGAIIPRKGMVNIRG
ncbi:hypothetical protein D0T53_01230 [Dysgonomonas sp. 216]|uniref:hypothetical protein n=1 Tax=Dysgonomonas sp. 216 TaxID=2302934 RepID=UPI0013D5B48E|nr:hypothetical protein [Dysgonomonas sp. 216]NDW17536.1 hypothetical protein [Dysgonomonas sp. 216]